MSKNTYIIDYECYDINNKLIKSGRYKVKNQISELSAKINFETFLKRKLPTMNRLVIISCSKQDDFIGFFEDIISKK